MYMESEKGELVNAINKDKYTINSYTSETVYFSETEDWTAIGIPITIVVTGLAYEYFVGTPIQCVYVRPFNVQARWYRSDSNYTVTRIEAEHYMQAPKYYFTECFDDTTYHDSDLLEHQKCTFSASLAVSYPTLNNTYYGTNSLPSGYAMGLNSADAYDENHFFYLILHYLEYTFWYTENGTQQPSVYARYDYFDAAYPDE